MLKKLGRGYDEKKMFSMSKIVNENNDKIGSIKQQVVFTQHDFRTHCDVPKLRKNHDVRDEGVVSSSVGVPDSSPTTIGTTETVLLSMMVVVMLNMVFNNVQPGGGLTPPSNDNKAESTSTENSGAQSSGTSVGGGAIPIVCVIQHGGARKRK